MAKSKAGVTAGFSDVVEEPDSAIEEKEAGGPVAEDVEGRARVRDASEEMVSRGQVAAWLRRNAQLKASRHGQCNGALNLAIRGLAEKMASGESLEAAVEKGAVDQ